MSRKLIFSFIIPLGKATLYPNKLNFAIKKTVFLTELGYLLCPKQITEL